MKTNPSSQTTSLSFARVFAILALSLILPGLVGCATKAQVEQLNLAIAHSMVPDVPSVRADGSTISSSGWEATSRKIDAFIQANPKSTVTIKALRMKQAMLLLRHQKFAMARAAFNEVKDPNGLYDRDKALWNLRDHLLWWYETDRLSAPDYDRSTQASKAIGDQITSLSSKPENTEIRDVLAWMRAYIDLHRISDLGETLAKPEFVEAVNNYSMWLTSDDVTAVVAGTSTNLSESISPTAKRRVQAMLIVTEAKRQSPYKSGDPVPDGLNENAKRLWHKLTQ